MMAKDPNARPQTPQDLQKEILACIAEIRGMSTQEVSRSAEPISPSETIDMSVASGQPLAPGVTIAQVYYLIEEIGDSPLGRRFLADDLLHRRRVSLLVLSPDLLADNSALTSLRETVNLVRKAPHPMLQEIYALETFTDCTLLAEEYITGISLLDVLRVRGALTAPEIVRLLSLLAPLADHATTHGLQHIDFSLSGIRFINREGNREGFQSTTLRRPLTAWESAHPKINAIDLSFLPASKGTWSGMATQMQGATPSASTGSCVRSLSLLAYELLGGPRARLEATGRYTPVASLTQEGNAVLRSGLIDEFKSVAELVRQLESTARVPPSSAQASDTAGRSTSELSRQRSSTQIPTAPPPERKTAETPIGAPVERRATPIVWLSIVASLLILGVGVGVYLMRPPAQPPPTQQVAEIPALSIGTEPAGATILLDGKLPQAPPNTFTHVPFGAHQLSVTLEGYEPIKQEVQVRRAMSPEIRLRLKPIVEVPALTIQTEPEGASILLDGRPPQVQPNTFAHVPFGSHQLSVTLDGYEPIKKELQVRRGMNPEVRLQLEPIVEMPALTIQTEPEGASILLDGKPPQVPPNTFNHVPFGSHQLSVTLDGYEPIKQEIQVRRGMSPEIRLGLKPTVEIPALTIQTEPEGASILLDGKPPQAQPNTFAHVPFGFHELSVSLDGYEPIKQELQVHRGMNPEVRLRLKPIVEIPALSIQTEPEGASILLDGKPPQVPPNTFAHVPFGSHQLSVTLDGYEPIKQELQVRGGMTPEIRLQLKPIVEIPALSIRTEPEGASILLDGKPPQVPPNTFNHVPFGTHRLSVTLDGYEPIQRELQVRRGIAPEVRLQLKPIQEIPALTIQTEPAGASILLDGKSPEVPPSIFTHVPFGSHELSVTLEGYEPIKQNLAIVAGMDPEIRLRLKASPAPDTFETYLRDAQRGDSSAMMKLGRLYFKKGTPADDVEGFNWLNRAYNAPNPNLEAGAYIGDCYLSGRGTKQDVQKAEEIIIPLANQNVVPAMTLAGRIFQYKGELKRAEAAQSADEQTRKRLEMQASEMDRLAVSWWERAEKDDWNAAAHLGKSYEQGWGGLEKNPGQAEVRYKAGASHGNPLSMLFYGFMIEKKPGRHHEAEQLISKAAAAGLPSAIKWCRDNNVDFSQKNSNDDHQ
jgi:TPR repeat protein